MEVTNRNFVSDSLPTEALIAEQDEFGKHLKDEIHDLFMFEVDFQVTEFRYEEYDDWYYAKGYFHFCGVQVSGEVKQSVFQRNQIKIDDMWEPLADCLYEFLIRKLADQCGKVRDEINVMKKEMSEMRQKVEKYESDASRFVSR